jgi:hypothetical protein
MDELERRERNLQSSRMGGFGSPPADASEMYIARGTRLGLMAVPPGHAYMVTDVHARYTALRQHLHTLVEHMLNYDGRPVAVGPEGDLFLSIVAMISGAQNAPVASVYPLAVDALKKYVLGCFDIMLQFDTPTGFFEYLYPESIATGHLYYSALLERAAASWKDLRKRIMYAIGQRLVPASGVGRAPPGGNVGGQRQSQKQRRKRTKRRRSSSSSRGKSKKHTKFLVYK